MPEYAFMPTAYIYLTDTQREQILQERLREAGLTAQAAHRIEDQFPDQLAQVRRLELQDLALQGSNFDADPQRRALFTQTIAAQAHLDDELSRLAAQVTGIPDAWSRYRAFTDQAGAELERTDLTSAAFQGASTADYLASRRDADRFVPTVTASELVEDLRRHLEADPEGPWHPDRVRETPDGWLAYDDEYGSYMWSTADTESGRYALEDYRAGEQLARELRDVASSHSSPQVSDQLDTVTITTLDGVELGASTDVYLAAKLADHERGEGWERDLSPVEEHLIMEEYLDTVAEFGTRHDNPSKPSPEITIYTTPTCQGCKLTKDKLTAAGVDFRSVDLSEHPDLVEEFKAAGLQSAPIIETPDGTRTAGFRPDRIKTIIATASTSLHPSPGSPQAPGGGHRQAEQSRGRTL